MPPLSALVAVKAVQALVVICAITPCCFIEKLFTEEEDRGVEGELAWRGVPGPDGGLTCLGDKRHYPNAYSNE